MKYSFLFSTLFFLSFSSISNCQSIDWENHYGGKSIEKVFSIIQTDNGDLLMAGESNSKDSIIDNYGSSDAWLIRTDEEGNLLWQKNYGGSDLDHFKSIKKAGSGYILAGITASPDNDVANHIGEIDFWLTKVSEDGSLEWEKTLGGLYNDFCEDVIVTNDGAYLVGGHAERTDAEQGNTFGNIDILIYKISSSGEILWEKTYDQSFFDRFAKMIPTSNGYLLGGSSYKEGEGNNFWIIEIDNDGNVLWEKNYGGSDYDVLDDITAAADGGYFLGGTSKSTDGDGMSTPFGLNDYWVLKIDELGKIIWESKYGHEFFDALNTVIPNPDGGALLCGTSDGKDLFESTDFWAVKIDKDGLVEWSKNYGLPNGDFFGEAIPTRDGGFVLGGTGQISQVDFDVDNDFLVYKICDDEVANCGQSNAVHSNSSNISNIKLSPNPSSDKVYIQFENKQVESIELLLYDVNSKLLNRQLIESHSGLNNYELDLSTYADGIYFVHLIAPQGQLISKLIVHD